MAEELSDMNPSIRVDGDVGGHFRGLEELLDLCEEAMRFLTDPRDFRWSRILDDQVDVSVVAEREGEKRLDKSQGSRPETILSLGWMSLASVELAH